MANYNEGSDNRLFDKNIRELIGKIFFKNDDVIVNAINEEDGLVLNRGLKNLERLENEFYGENRHKKKIILPHKREVDYYTENLSKKKEKEKDSKSDDKDEKDSEDDDDEDDEDDD
mgnify:CR=1 FL=1